MKLVVLLIAILTGCSLGPVQVTHKDGEMPKIYVRSSMKNCKFVVKARVREWYKTEFKFKCRVEI